MKRGRKPMFVSLQGQKYTLDQLASLAGIQKPTLYQRIKKGYQPNEILRPTHKLHIPVDMQTTTY